jgi:hypothetical protein
LWWRLQASPQTTEAAASSFRMMCVFLSVVLAIGAVIMIAIVRRSWVILAGGFPETRMDVP